MIARNIVKRAVDVESIFACDVSIHIIHNDIFLYFARLDINFDIVLTVYIFDCICVVSNNKRIRCCKGISHACYHNIAVGIFRGSFSYKRAFIVCNMQSVFICNYVIRNRVIFNFDFLLIFKEYLCITQSEIFLKIKILLCKQNIFL